MIKILFLLFPKHLSCFAFFLFVSLVACILAFLCDSFSYFLYLLLHNPLFLRCLGLTEHFLNFIILTFSFFHKRNLICSFCSCQASAVEILTILNSAFILKPKNIKTFSKWFKHKINQIFKSKFEEILFTESLKKIIINAHSSKEDMSLLLLKHLLISYLKYLSII